MRKRLIEKFTKSKEGSLGYTLTEVLVVVGIIAIVCAIAIPSIIALSKTLRFKQANDYAKSIFMAAQQNLTEMRSEGALRQLQRLRDSDNADEKTQPIPAGTGFPEEAQAEYVYTYSGEPAFDLVLPVGSIESTARSGNIIIEYNPITGNVFAVYYCEKGTVDELVQKYRSAQLPRDAEGEEVDKVAVAARKDLMLGYYDGSDLLSSQIELEKTAASINFVNGEEGIVEVMVPMPATFYGDHSTFAKALKVDLTLTGEQYMEEIAAGQTPARSGIISIPLKAAGQTDFEMGTDGKTVILRLPIDSLRDKLSFANFSSGTQATAAGVANTSAASLTSILSEYDMDSDGKITGANFAILPGENITIQADVQCVVDGLEVKVESGILTGVNPMFDSLQVSSSGKYVLTVSNGRNLQNLNALSPTIAKNVETVVFNSDINWATTVKYYDNGSYTNAPEEAPARALPYFVPIHNEDLFGTAKFIFPGDDSDGGLGGIIQDILNGITGGLWGKFTNSEVPSLTDELDQGTAVSHATIQGNGHKVLNLNIDSTRYEVPHAGTDNEGTFYATGATQVVDYYFTGLFGYVNTPIDGLHIVNPIVKGHNFDDSEKRIPIIVDSIFGPIQLGSKLVSSYNNPATGALLGAGGFNTLLTNCSVYIDTEAEGYNATKMGQEDFNADAVQSWYGVSGEGAVGGLVGYAKSHLSVTGELDGNLEHLAFSKCFAAVPVSGNMRTSSDKDFGYSNGVGGLIGNSQLTNFYQCYASGNVRANGCRVEESTLGGIGNKLLEISNIKVNLFGNTLELLYSTRGSWGAGGFVGTSHGTRYTNCFATGNVTGSAPNSSPIKRGAGGFVGFMGIDETTDYGNTDTKIAQRTVFSNCYAVGKAVTNGTTVESFSGANGRLSESLNISATLTQSLTYMVSNYYQLYAPYYYLNNRAPSYESYYIFKDSYFLSDYHTGSNQANSLTCAEPLQYNLFVNMPSYRKPDDAWVLSQVNSIKEIPLVKISGNYGSASSSYTYGNVYFERFKNSDPSLDTIYKELYTKGFSASDWVNASAETTHPYNLNTGGSVYPFSKLVGMDYYGDWPSKPSDMGLAYYEQYDGVDQTHYYFDKAHTDEGDDARLSLLGGDSMVENDGYAIFSAKPDKLYVQIGDSATTYELTSSINNSAYIIRVDASTYQVFHMDNAKLGDKTVDLVDIARNQLIENGQYENFYVKVTASHSSDMSNAYTMYFNPDVAISHVNPSNGASDAAKPASAPKTMHVRSARQFKALGSLSKYWGEGYTYIQDLHIDAAKYDGLKDNTKASVIGTSAKPFNATYTYVNREGGEQRARIEGFLPTGSGFFGVIGDSGKLENLLFTVGDVTIGSSNTECVGVVAGKSSGTLANVDLSLTGTASLTAKDSAGLLVGYSSGNISESQVTAKESATLTASNAGGFAGKLTGTTIDGKTNGIKVTDSELKLQSSLTLKGCTNAGGFIGTAANLTANNLKVDLKSVSAEAVYLGGLAGSLTDSTVENMSVDLSSLTNQTTGGTTAGAAGFAKETSFTKADVTASGAISGDTAAGFLGISEENAKAQNCAITVKTVEGKNKAAGVVGVLGTNGSFDNVTVNLTGSTVKSTAGDAAGFAIEVKKGAIIQGSSNVKLNDTTIDGKISAAGHTVTVNGSVIDSAVRGTKKDNRPSAIQSDGSAAGFAITLGSGSDTRISGCVVTPAENNSDYKGNSNANLVISGETASAGFVLTIGSDATVSGCTALGSVKGGTPAGFAGTNNGSITGSTANVSLSGGYAFVADNAKTVARCYGWYNDGSDDSAKLTTVMGGSGKCYSSYFADLVTPVSTNAETGDVEELDSVVLYAANGTSETMTASELSGNVALTKLTGQKDDPQTYSWNAAGGRDEYPYTLEGKHYLYPMLRDHYGDWSTPPQFAYGVAYYELYGEDAKTAPMKIRMVDMSNASETVEKKSISGMYLANGTEGLTAAFNNEGTIGQHGYAVFAKKGLNILTTSTQVLREISIKVSDTKTIIYALYAITAEDVPSGGFSNTTGDAKTTVNVNFADAINASGTYQVRTPDQLAKIGTEPKANFEQTHDIAIADFLPAGVTADKYTAAELGGTYNGNSLKLTVDKASVSWMSNVKGEVKDLVLTVKGDVAAPVFVAVDGKLNLNKDVSLGSISTGALVGESTGTVKAGAVSTGAVSSMLFGDLKNAQITSVQITGDAKQVFGSAKAIEPNENGIKVGDVIVTGNVTGQFFGAVAGKVDAGILSAKSVSDQVFGDVSGSVKTGAITVSGNVGTQVFGGVTGTVTAGDITINGTTPTVVKSVGSALTKTPGTVNVGKIEITGKADAVSGAINGDVDTKEIILSGGAGQVFGNVSAGSVDVVGSISVTGDATQIFGNVSGAVQTGAITVSGNAPTVVSSVGKNGSFAVKAPASDKIWVKTASETTVFGEIEGSVTLGEIDIDGTAKQIFGDVSAALSSGNVSVSGALSGNVMGQKSTASTATLGNITVDSIGGKILASATGGSVSFGDITIGTAAADAQTVSEEAVFSAADGEKAAPEGTTTSTSPTEPAVTGMQTLFGAVSNGATVSGKALNLNGKDVKNVLFASADGAKTEIKGFQVAAGAIHGGIVGPVSNGAKVSGFGVNVGAVQSDLIGDVSGSSTIDGLTVTLTSLNGKLITSSTDSSIKNITANGLGAITQSVIGPVSGGSVEKASFGVSTISTTLIESISSKATLDGVTLTADSMTVADSKTSGVLVSSVPSGSTVKNSKVTISGTLDATASSTFGGLVGSNEGTLEKNTVSITAFKVSGDGSFGGLTGTSKGSVTSNTVTADISHSGGTEGVTIGGLVGNMSGGSLNGDQVSGKISGSAVGSSKVGGAVGSMADGTSATNVTATMEIAAGWAGSNKVHAGTRVFEKDSMDKGPVGVFVGYVGNAALTNCKSDWKDNTNYQFLGETPVTVEELSNGIVSTGKLYSDGFVYDSSLNTYTAGEQTVTVNNVADDATCNHVALNLSGGCTFYLKEEGKRMQTHGVDTYYYAEGEKKNQSSYEKGADAVMGSVNTASVTFKQLISSDTTNTTDYYIQTSDGYHRITITRTSDVPQGWDQLYKTTVYTYTITWDGASQPYEFKETRQRYNPSKLDKNYRDANVVSSFDSSVGIQGIYTLSQPTLSADKYLLVASDGNAYNGDKSATVKDRFDMHDSALCSVIWSKADLGNATLCGKNSYATSEVTDGKIYAAYTTGGQECKLYPLTENPNAYYIVTYTQTHTEEKFQKQFITHAAAGGTQEVTEETTTPAGESGGEA